MITIRDKSTESLTAVEIDNAIKLIIQDIEWVKADLERAQSYKTLDLKRGIIENLVGPSLRRMKLQVDFVKRNG